VDAVIDEHNRNLIPVLRVKLFVIEFGWHNPRIMPMSEVMPPLSGQNAVLAFFDVDNTLMRGASAP